MSLWAGYWRGKETLDPILSEIPKKNIYQNLLTRPKLKVRTLSGNIYHYGPEVNMRYANATVSMEDYGAGETFSWFYPMDNEVQIILKGKAEITYSLEGMNHTVEKKMTVEEGDVYIIPRGARLTFKVDTSGPLVHLCVTIPGLATPQRISGSVEELK
jgi:mannose-6-phosphate isomerase-like protein (cupin superfamily)